MTTSHSDAKRILITGGAGFIGSNLAELALGRGHSVTVLDDLSTGFADNLDGLDVRFVEGSILDEDSLSSAMAGADSVVHLAALGSVPRSIKDPQATHAANATGTLAVLEAARQAGVQHVVSASSSSVYGLNPALPKHEREWVRPMSPYAVTKLATEQYTLAYQESFGLQTLAFRFFNVYGPKQRAGHVYAAVIPTWLDALFRGEPLWVNGDGSNSRDFTYVATVCAVLLDAVERACHAPRAGQPGLRHQHDPERPGPADRDHDGPGARRAPPRPAAGRRAALSGGQRHVAVAVPGGRAGRTW